MSYKIEKVESLPSGARKASKVYDDILNDVSKQSVGCYYISMDGKKINTLFTALAKRMKSHKDLLLHKISDKIYVEKLPASKSKGRVET